jgi:hypothetical protein
MLPTPTPTPSPSIPPAPTPAPSVEPLPPQRPWTGHLPLAFAAIGAGLGAAALIVAISRPTAPPQPGAVPAATYTADQIATAKTKTCAAAKRSISGMAANTNRANPTGPGDALGWANFANARIAYLSAALWLPGQVDPATPQDLKDAVNGFAATAADGASRSISEDNTHENVEQSRNDLDTLNVASKEIQRLCE